MRHGITTSAQIEWIDSKIFEKHLSKIVNLKNLMRLLSGGFGLSGVEGKIATIKYARENNIPYLGYASECSLLWLNMLEMSVG
jgi:CTP synthase